MINVLYVITKGRWGGAQKYVYDLATKLPWREFRVSVAVGQGDELPRRLRLAGLETLKLPSLSRDPNWRNDWQSLRQLKHLIDERQPDFIHLNSSKVGLLGALAGRWHNLSRKRKPVRIIFTAHGWAFREERSFVERLVIKLLSWLTIVLSHQAITVSHFDFLLARKWPLIRNKLCPIHNGIEAPNFIPREQARKKLGLENQTFTIGTIAELHKNKGLNYLLKALSLSGLNSNSDCRLLVIGEGEERKKLELEIEILGLKEVVSLLVQIDNDATLLNAFDLFVLPSVKEGLPYVLLEAGMANLPILATDVGGIPEIIENMESGVLVKPRQPSELARALQFLAQNPQKRRKLGTNLRQRVRRKFSTEQMVKATMAIYNDEYEKAHI